MSSRPRHDLYRIDDVLLRAGGAALVAAAAAVAGVVLFGLSSGSADGRDAGVAALEAHAPVLALALACPVVLLGTGVAMRRRERRIAAIWSLLNKDALLRVPSLLANSDFAREDLERAVRFLNNRGHAHYLWDHKHDTILDARLQSHVLHFEKCGECGGSVSLQVSIVSGEIPRCPFCHAPVSVSSLEERRREAIDAIRSESRDVATERSAAPASGPGFSIGVFLVLLLVFWPAAVAYAWLKSQRER